ncbi:C-type lectin domain family 4 member E-like isoform X1, partial [Clarias magur]
SKPSRCYRLAVVCLLMLVVLSLVAIAMLWGNLINLTSERDQLQTTSYNNLTTERDQLQTSYNNLIIERDQLQTSYRNLNREKHELQASCNHCTSDKAEIETRNKKLANERDQFQRSRDEVQRRYSQLKNDINTPGWRYFSSSIYYISTEKRSWSEGREDCRRRGADLVIINSREEQDFVEVWRRGEGAWTGANDRDREGNWKWVDGTPVIHG